MSEHEGLVAEIRQILDSHTNDTGVLQAVLRLAEEIAARGPADGPVQEQRVHSARMGQSRFEIWLFQDWPCASCTVPGWRATIRAVDENCTGPTLHLLRDGCVDQSSAVVFPTMAETLESLEKALLALVASGS